MIGEEVRRLDGSDAMRAKGHRDSGVDDIDHERAARTLPVLRQILGVEPAT